MQEIQKVLQNIRHLDIDLSVLLPGQGSGETNETTTADGIYGDFMIDKLSLLTETQITRISRNQVSYEMLITHRTGFAKLTIAFYFLYQSKARNRSLDWSRYRSAPLAYLV